MPLIATIRRVRTRRAPVSQIPAANAAREFALRVRSTARGRPLVSGCALGRIRTSDTRFRKPMLYPLSYEGGECVSAGQTLSAVLGRSARCPIPARGVPVRTASTDFPNCVSLVFRPRCVVWGNGRRCTRARWAHVTRVAAFLVECALPRVRACRHRFGVSKQRGPRAASADLAVRNHGRRALLRSRFCPIRINAAAPSRSTSSPTRGLPNTTSARRAAGPVKGSPQSCPTPAPRVGWKTSFSASEYTVLDEALHCDRGSARSGSGGL